MSRRPPTGKRPSKDSKIFAKKPLKMSISSQRKVHKPAVIRNAGPTFELSLSSHFENPNILRNIEIDANGRPQMLDVKRSVSSVGSLSTKRIGLRKVSVNNKATNLRHIGGRIGVGAYEITVPKVDRCQCVRKNIQTIENIKKFT